MASASRYMIADHEVEENVIEAELGGLLNKLIMCNKEEKNPGHHNQFIQMDKFGTDSLPSLPRAFPLSKEDIVRWVKSCAGMVVRVNMKYCSLNRPDTWDGKSPYPFSEFKGKRMNHVGSGWVSDFNSNASDIPFTYCPLCKKCKEEGTVETCWNFTIYTARHVVYDDSEAKECEVIFCEDKPRGVGAFVAQGGMMDHADTDTDSCWMSCFTHDTSFGEEAEKLRDNLFDTRWYLKQVLAEYDASFKEEDDGGDHDKDSSKGVDSYSKDAANINEEAGSNVHNKKSTEEHEGAQAEIDPDSKENTTGYTKKAKNDDLSDAIIADLSIPVVCISHPHGRMKYISVGHLKSEEGGAVTYTTPTCKGSSGGLVLSTGQWAWNENRERWVKINDKKSAFVTSHPHKGALYGGDGSSTVGVIYSPQI